MSNNRYTPICYSYTWQIQRRSTDGKNMHLTGKQQMFTNSIAVAEITAIINENIPKNHDSKIAVFCDNKFVVGVANDLHECHKIISH